MKVAFLTLGCKVNQYETQALKELFKKEHFEIVEASEPADVFIINSCTVTQFGSKKTRQTLRHFKKKNPLSIAVLTGCYPQAYPEIKEEIAEADIITGTQNRSELLSLVKKALNEKKQIASIPPYPAHSPFEPLKIHEFSSHTRAFVKIEDGCDRFCSYCIIPTARGPVRSKPLDDIQNELKALGEKGYQEVVLVGINLSSYGKDLHGPSLIDAVATACSIDSIQRVRLGSLEPDLLRREDILALSKMPKFCPQFHLSLQSGCDRTLLRMKRRYNAEDYRALVKDIREIHPNPSITTDVMVGFAGETEEEFAESCRFIRSIGFSKIHIFPYSIRPGTAAASFPHQCTHHTKKERASVLSKIAKELQQDFYSSQIGTTQEVLFEAETDGVFYGYTKNYTPCSLPFSKDMTGKIANVKIVDYDFSGCLGVLTKPEFANQPVKNR